MVPMTPEQRKELIRLLQQGEQLSPEWARLIFPPEKMEYELVYYGKEREEDTMLQNSGKKIQYQHNWLSPKSFNRFFQCLRGGTAKVFSFRTRRGIIRQRNK